MSLRDGGRSSRSSSEIEDWYTASSVIGSFLPAVQWQSCTGTDISGREARGQSNFCEGYYDLERVPMLPGDWQMIIVETEPINPLYTGQYAVGPYTANTVEPSGSDPARAGGIFGSYAQAYDGFYATMAASSCNTGARWNRSCSGGRCGAGVVVGAALRVWTLCVVFAYGQRQPLADGGGDGGG